MSIFKRIFSESLSSSFFELWNNKLRSALSLIGITIGIICIISVLSSVDSLKGNIKSSLSNLGNDVIYIQKWPWMPENNEPYKWWEYFKRPAANLNELKALQPKVSNKASTALVVMIEEQIAKYENKNIENAAVTGVTQDYQYIRNLDYENGRYFTDLEFESGKQVAIIGADIKNALFTSRDPIGKKINFLQRDYTVVGVLNKEGKDLLGMTQDNVVLAPYKSISKITNVEDYTPFIAIKPLVELNFEDFKIELRAILRKIRKLHPKEKDDFSFNQISLLSSSIEGIFMILNIAALIIGGFSILVGAFGVANIMYVSVKERESQIGLKKALGAKRIFILSEFLIESVILCIIGGLIGLAIVWLLFYLINLILAANESGLVLYVSFKFVVWGLVISILTGIISGFLPALRASKLKPIEAIRS
jgi:putative ABC transport system permease protein